MEKKYVMFVDEAGRLMERKQKYFSMLGIIFEEDYCVGLNNGLCDLKKALDKYKKFLKLNIDSPIGIVEFLRNLNFKAIPISLEVDHTKDDSTYETVVERLLEIYNSFLINNEAKGGIVIRDGINRDSFLVKQKFLDVYNNRNNDFCGESRINSFCIEKKEDKTYEAGLESMETLTEILLKDYSDIEEGTTEFEAKKQIITDVKDKIYDGRVKTFLDFELGNVENM